VFLASDGDDVSTPQLLRHLAGALDKKVLLLPVPIAVLQGLGKLCGASAAVARLSGDLRVDIGKNRELLGWTPPYSIVEGLREMVNAYRNNDKRHSNGDRR
jgi:nucleoside-diphosphate-sugar epimerase